MTFEEWFKLESQSCLDDLFEHPPNKQERANTIWYWLHKAYVMGRAHERIDMTPPLGEARYEELAKAAEETSADANINAGWLGTKSLDGYNG